ncbi:MAG: hypothetical protein RID94_06850 [Miltoncostaeaceae bacterium]
MALLVGALAPPRITPWWPATAHRGPFRPLGVGAVTRRRSQSAYTAFLDRGAGPDTPAARRFARRLDEARARVWASDAPAPEAAYLVTVTDGRPGVVPVGTEAARDLLRTVDR